LITRSDSGAGQFNFSQVAETATAAAIANLTFTIPIGVSQARFRDSAFNSLVAAFSTS